jgi:hypothetical protein
MTCAEVQQVLGTFVHGRADAPGTPGVAEHLAGCAECAGLAALFARLERDPVWEPAPSYFGSILARVHERVAPARRGSFVPAWFLRLALPAASVAAAVLVAVEISSVTPQPASPGVTVADLPATELADFVEEQSVVGTPRTLSAERAVAQDDAGLLKELVKTLPAPLSESVEESVYGLSGDAGGDLAGQSISEADAEELVPILEHEHHR